MIFAADDMRDAHEVIINNNGEIIRRHTVGTYNNEIADSISFKLYSTTY